MRSVPVLAASDRAAGGAQDPEHSANHHQDDADRPQNGNRDDKTHDQQHDAKNDHFGSYSEVGAAGPAGPVRVQRELSPSTSTLRWNRMPARPPSRAVRMAAAIAMRPTAVTSPSSTGMRGRFSCAYTLYCEPATAANAAKMMAMTTPHSHTARPCLIPLKRAIRPAT